MNNILYCFSLFPDSTRKFFFLKKFFSTQTSHYILSLIPAWHFYILHSTISPFPYPRSLSFVFYLHLLPLSFSLVLASPLSFFSSLSPSCSSPFTSFSPSSLLRHYSSSVSLHPSSSDHIHSFSFTYILLFLTTTSFSFLLSSLVLSTISFPLLHC